MKIFIVLVLLSCGFIYGQSLSGLKGLVNIPTAEIGSDGNFSAGLSYLHKKHLGLTENKHNAMAFYFNFVFLPRFELNLRLMRKLGLPNYDSNTMDRVPSIKFLALKESKNLPAIAFGANDLMTVFGGTEAIHFNSLYAVATKNFYYNGFKIGTSLGYGSDVLEANHYEFIGVFGGIGFELDSNKIGFEYDGDTFNIGLSKTFYNCFNMQIATKNFDSLYFSGGYTFNLFN